jgi:hypothetical protein
MNVVLFLLENPNVGVVNSMDTRVPMHLRPPSTSKSEESMYPEDLAHYSTSTQRGHEHHRLPVGRRRLPRLRHPQQPRPRGEPPLRPWPRLRVLLLRLHLVRRRALGRRRRGRPERRRRAGRLRPPHLDRLRGRGASIPELDPDARTRCWARSRSAASTPSSSQQNGPPEVLDTWAGNQALFNLYMAQSLPELSAGTPAVRQVGTSDETGSSGRSAFP